MTYVLKLYLAGVAVGVLLGVTAVGLVDVVEFHQHCSAVPLLGGWYCR